MKTANMIIEHWREKTLMRMRDVGLDTRGGDEKIHFGIEAALSEIVVVLKKDGCLRRLEVSWSSRYGLARSGEG